MPVTAEQRERVERWLAALRSGEYRQTHSGFLRDPVGYCPLGVAAEVAGVGEWKRHREGESVFFDFHVDPDLPEEHKSLVGLYGLTKAQCAEITRLNDIEEMTLNQIADHIDSTYGLTTEED